MKIWKTDPTRLIRRKKSILMKILVSIFFSNHPITLTYDHPITGPYHTGQRVAVSYYQWTPLILAIAAFLFHLPYIVWHIMAVSSGMPLESMLSAAREVSKVQKDGGSRDGFINDILFR